MKNVTVESCLGLHYPPKEWPKPGDKTSCFVDVLPVKKTLILTYQLYCKKKKMYYKLANKLAGF